MKLSLIKGFARRKVSVAALFVLLIIILMAFLGPELCRYSPLAQNIPARFSPASTKHWLGTDYAGRDTFTRIVYGARISLAISFAGVFSGGATGVILGLLSYYGDPLDSFISRFLELLMAFPGLILAVIMIAILGPGTTSATIVSALIVVPIFAKVTRGNVLSIKGSDFVKACRVCGGSDMRIIFTHILPNSLAMIIVTFTLNMGTSVLLIASLSSIGLGAPPPTPEWGAMLNDSRAYMRYYPLGVLAPGLMLTLLVMSLSLVGDGLRDALDPRLKNL